MVHTQAEADTFTSRYAGYVIKARVVSDNEIHRDSRAVDGRAYRQPLRSRGVSGWAIVLLLLIALVVVGFTTGWIQRTFDITMR